MGAVPEKSKQSEPEESEESRHERLTRNWNELLQELRVTQTGSQILAGFLLTVPFSSRFEVLSHHQVVIYLVVLCAAVLSTGFVIAPVAFHRLLFRQREREWLVGAANWSARAGLLMLVCTCSGVLYLIFDVTLSTTAGLISLGASLTFFIVLWGLLPLAVRDDD